MKIGIIGSGDVGQAIGLGFSNLCHEVKIGSREPKSEKLQNWIKKAKKSSTGTFEETAKFGEIIILATLWTGTESALKLAKFENLANKIVIDVTNPLDFSSGMPPKLAVGFNNSGGETIQKLLPKSHVVKTLNIIGNKYMVNPKFKEGDPDMFLCGNNKEAKKKVEQILKDFGWKYITDLGNIDQARIMEPLCILWVNFGIINNSWDHAFKVLRK